MSERKKEKELHRTSITQSSIPNIRKDEKEGFLETVTNFCFPLDWQFSLEDEPNIRKEPAKKLM